VIVAGILMYEALDELADLAYNRITSVTSAQLGKGIPVRLAQYTLLEHVIHSATFHQG
jgi:hypothetical protein